MYISAEKCDWASWHTDTQQYNIHSTWVSQYDGLFLVSMWTNFPFDPRDASSFQPLDAFHNTLRKARTYDKLILIYKHFIYKYTHVFTCTHSELYNIQRPNALTSSIASRSCTVHNMKVIRASIHWKPFKQFSHCAVSFDMCVCVCCSLIYCNQTYVLCTRYWNGNSRWNHLSVREGASDFVESFWIQNKFELV